MDLYDDELEEDATRFMKDLSLFEVPPRECFRSTSTTPKRSETSAGEDFEKKRELYANLNLRGQSISHLARRTDTDNNVDSSYGKILTKTTNYSLHVNNTGTQSPVSVSCRTSPLSQPVYYGPRKDLCNNTKTAFANANRPVGAIESFIVQGEQHGKPKDPPAYSKIDRASVIAASKFPTPKQPVNINVSTASGIKNANNIIGYPLVTTHSSVKSSILPTDENLLVKTTIPQNKNSVGSVSYITTRLGQDSLHSSPRSSLSSSSGSRESHHSGSPRTSYTGPIYENIYSLRNVEYSPKIGATLESRQQSPRSSSSVDSRHSNSSYGTIPKQTTPPVEPPPPYPYPKSNSEYPIYANLLELAPKVSVSATSTSSLSQVINRSALNSNMPHVSGVQYTSVTSASHLNSGSSAPLASAGYSCQPVSATNIYQVSSAVSSHHQHSTSSSSTTIPKQPYLSATNSNKVACGIQVSMSHMSSMAAHLQPSYHGSYGSVQNQQLAPQNFNSTQPCPQQNWAHGNLPYVRPPEVPQPLDSKISSASIPASLPQPVHSQILTSCMSSQAIAAGQLPPPPPYPGTGYKPNTLNSKTLLPYNVTSPRPKGPTEAEKKMEALTKQIEDEMENNPEGEYFGESLQANLLIMNFVVKLIVSLKGI